jgi:hypothetical protein
MQCVLVPCHFGAFTFSRNIPQRAPTSCPVVELSKKLLVLWDADDGSQHEYHDLETIPQHVEDDTLQQFGEWRTS